LTLLACWRTAEHSYPCIQYQLLFIWFRRSRSRGRAKSRASNCANRWLC